MTQIEEVPDPDVKNIKLSKMFSRKKSLNKIIVDEKENNNSHKVHTTKLSENLKKRISQQSLQPEEKIDSSISHGDHSFSRKVSIAHFPPDDMPPSLPSQDAFDHSNTVILSDDL